MNEPLPDIRRLSSFGIGCLHLRPTEREEQPNVDTYVDSLRTFLETTPGITAVDIQAPFQGAIRPMTGEPGITEGGYAWPNFLGFELRFRAHIPQDQQAGTSRLFRVHYEPENFRVIIRYGVQRPACFVSTDPPTHLPSEGIVVVREHLKAHATKAAFAVETLGPTPMHVEAFVDEKSDATTEGFEYAFHRTQGYSKATFVCKSGEFATAEEAEEALFEELDEPVEMFYSIVAARLRQRQAGRRLQELNNEVINLYTRGRMRSRLKRAFVASARLRDLTVGIARFEASQEADVARLTREAAPLGSTKPLYLLPLLEDELARLPSDTRAMKTTVELFERRRLNTVQTIPVVAATLGASALGAGLTLALTRPTPTPVVRPTVVIRQPASPAPTLPQPSKRSKPRGAVQP